MNERATAPLTRGLRNMNRFFLRLAWPPRAFLMHVYIPWRSQSAVGAELGFVFVSGDVYPSAEYFLRKLPRNIEIVADTTILEIEWD